MARRLQGIAFGSEPGQAPQGAAAAAAASTAREAGATPEPRSGTRLFSFRLRFKRDVAISAEQAAWQPRTEGDLPPLWAAPPEGAQPPAAPAAPARGAQGPVPPSSSRAEANIPPTQMVPTPPGVPHNRKPRPGVRGFKAPNKTEAEGPVSPGRHAETMSEAESSADMSSVASAAPVAPAGRKVPSGSFKDTKSPKRRMQVFVAPPGAEAAAEAGPPHRQACKVPHLQASLFDSEPAPSPPRRNSSTAACSSQFFSDPPHQGRSDAAASSRIAEGLGDLPFAGAAWPQCEASSSDESVERNSFTFAGEAEDVKKVAKACCWHVVDTGDLDGKAASSEDALAPNAKVVVVLASAACGEAACVGVRRARKMVGKTQKPIIVMLLGSTVSPSFEACSAEDHVANLQLSLLRSGADDVIFGAAPTARIAIVMSVTRVEAKRAAFAEKARAMKEQHQQALRRAAELEPKDGMFWRSIHKIFEEFPEMKSSLCEEPAPGAQVGPCELKQQLGKGGFGAVFEADNAETGKKEAVKAIPKEKLANLREVGCLWREIRALRCLRHKHTVSLKGIEHGPTHVFLRMSLVGQCNLFKIIRTAQRLQVDQAQKYQTQLSSAVAYCHSRGLAHRDLKPENIAVSGCLTRITVVDFGSAVPLRAPCHDMAGTMPFMAPEVLEADNTDAYIPERVDTWSMGVLLLEMLCGTRKMDRMLGWADPLSPTPQRSDELRAYFSQPGALAAALKEDLGTVDDDLFELLNGMLEFEPTARWTADQVTSSAWLPDQQA